MIQCKWIIIYLGLITVNCKKCGVALKVDDMGATRKLISRGAEEFYCIPCLAIKFSVTEDILREKIEYWRNSGCSLFAKKPENDTKGKANG